MLPLVPLTRAALLAQCGRQAEQRAAAGENWYDTGYVFTTRTGRPVEPRNNSRSFDRIVASVDLPKITFHDLRRTAATLLKDLGVPARDAQMILGHSTVTVTLGIYSEVFDTEIASALDRVNQALRHTSTEGATPL
jgi:integrase